MRIRRAALFALLVAFVAFVGSGAYVAGYSHGQRGASVAVGATPVASPTPTGGIQSRFEVFWEAWRIVEGEFYDQSAVSYEKITYGAIRGMLESLGDPHTGFANPTIARISDEDMRGTFDGIGVQVEMKEGKLTVVAPMEGTPGEKAGIRPGDVIAMVDETDTAQLSLMEAVGRIRGPRGTAVKLTIRREGVAEPIVVEVVRAEIRPVNVRARMLDGSVGYVKLNSFTENAGQDVRGAIRDLLGQRPKALILDLRNNPGGLLEASVDVTSQFLADGVVLYEQRRGSGQVPIRVKKGGVATDLPLAVLVNKGSASASEIVAGALQDHGRAVIVGENTFGKDSVQNIHRLSDESSLRVTFARWYTPKRQEIRQKGLTPDLVVPLSEEDSRSGADPQLDRARESLLGR